MTVLLGNKRKTKHIFFSKKLLHYCCKNLLSHKNYYAFSC